MADQYIENLSKLRDNDVLLSSFPRSGNTWLRLLLCSVLRQKEGHPPEVSADNFDRYLPEIYQLDLDSYLPTPGVGGRLVKTHDAYDIFPDTAPPEGGHHGALANGGIFGNIPLHELPVRPHRCVYIFRRPEDSLASFYNLYRNQQHNLNGTYADMNEFCRQWADLWSHNTLSHLAATEREPENWLLIRYASIKTDPAGILGRVCEFVGLEANPEQLTRAIEANTFSRLKKEQATRAIRPGQMNTFARGEVGGWSDELDDETLSIVANATGEAFERAKSLSPLCSSVSQ